MMHHDEINMICPNCGEEIEVYRTRSTKKGNSKLFVAEHPEEPDCPAIYKPKIYRDTEEGCIEGYSRYRKTLEGPYK